MGARGARALAAYVAKDKPLPQTMEHYDDRADKLVGLRKRGVPVQVEQKLAMSEEFKPISFFDGKAWFRGVLDVVVVGGTIARSTDWKTGKMPDDGDAEYEQLALSAQLVFAHYPEVQEVEHGVRLAGLRRRPPSVPTSATAWSPLWNKLWPRSTS